MGQLIIRRPAVDGHFRCTEAETPTDGFLTTWRNPEGVKRQGPKLPEATHPAVSLSSAIKKLAAVTSLNPAPRTPQPKGGQILGTSPMAPY